MAVSHLTQPNNLRYADYTTLTAEGKEELKNFLMKVKEESEKAGLKPNIQKTKIMASGPTAAAAAKSLQLSSPTTSRQIDGGKKWKQWQTLFWGVPKSLQMVTAAMKFKNACSLVEKLWPT